MPALAFSSNFDEGLRAGTTSSLSMNGIVPPDCGLCTWSLYSVETDQAVVVLQVVEIMYWHKGYMFYFE